MKKEYNQLSVNQEAVRLKLVEWIRLDVENEFDQVQIVLDDTMLESLVERCTSEVNLLMLRGVIRNSVTRMCNEFVASYQGQMLDTDELLVITLSGTGDGSFQVINKM